MYDLITNFALNCEEIEQKNGICKQLFTLIKPQLTASHKHYEDGKKGGRPKKIKNPPFENKKTNENVNVNVNENENVEVVEDTATTKNDFSDLSLWHGEYSNVHLTDNQYSKLIQIIGKKEVLDGLIEDLSANIASKKENAPPYDEEFPDMHYAKLKAYWDYRRLKGNSPPKTIADKQAEFKAQLKALADKFRAEDEKERINSG